MLPLDRSCLSTAQLQITASLSVAHRDETKRKNQNEKAKQRSRLHAISTVKYRPYVVVGVRLGLLEYQDNKMPSFSPFPLHSSSSLPFPLLSSSSPTMMCLVLYSLIGKSRAPFSVNAFVPPDDGDGDDICTDQC